MELVKLENMRDRIQERIEDLERFTDGAYESFRVGGSRPTGYIGGQTDSKIDEVVFLEGHLDLIKQEIEDYDEAKERVYCIYCECKKCKSAFTTRIVEAMRLKSKQEEAEAEPEPETQKYLWTVRCGGQCQGVWSQQENIFDSFEKFKEYINRMVNCHDSLTISINKMSVKKM